MVRPPVAMSAAWGGHSRTTWGGLRTLGTRFTPACSRKAVSMAPGVAQAGQRRRCNRVGLSECTSVAQAGQRQKCNRIDLSECAGVAQGERQEEISHRHGSILVGIGAPKGASENSPGWSRVSGATLGRREISTHHLPNRIDLSECPGVAQAGQRRKCHIIYLSECPDIAQAGQRRKCNRIDLSECLIIAQAAADTQPP